MIEPVIEVHRVPPPNYEGETRDVGHLRASNGVTAVVLPVSLSMLDDWTVVDRYVKPRLLTFLEIETKLVDGGKRNGDGDDSP